MKKLPKQLLNALRSQELIVFAGAGVSRGEPAGLPNFLELAREIAQGTGQERDEHEHVDRFLGKLQERHVDVHIRARNILLVKEPEPTQLHHNLLRLYPELDSVRVVTTNFDHLFEDASTEVFDSKPEVFRAPALPLGREFSGIVHLHGDLSHPDGMVLTDADFGRAYLIEGWASRFLVDMFRSFTVLFVGYSHDDTVMHYLARALPISETKRFILTDEAENDRWEILGIEPIVYQSLPDLYEYADDLANHVRRGALDWKREISELLQNPPPLDENEANLIEEALLDETKVRFFVDIAPAVEWLDWFDRRNHFDALFRRGEFEGFDERNRQLAQWLAWKFACRCPDELFQLIGRHGVRVHPFFWFELGRAVGLGQDMTLEGKTLSRWVSLLLATAPAGQNVEVLSWLGERCIKSESLDSLLDIFNAMATSLLTYTSIDGWPSAEGSGQYEINDLWEKGLKPNLGLMAVPLLDSATEHLAARHRMLEIWQDTEYYKYSDNLDRSAIEPHEQDEYPECVDVWIDVVRDCLEWLASNKPGVVDEWCDRFINADSPLLRRMAIFVLPKRIDITSDEKIDWLLDKTDIHELLIHHEIFQAMRQVYRSVSTEHRRAVIQVVIAYRGVHQEHEEAESQTAYQHFAWLHWLHEAAPECDLTKKALEKVQGRHPDFRAAEHPDFFDWTEISFGSGNRSPWSVKELLAEPVEEWLERLLSFQQTSFDGPDRDGLLLAVQEAVGQQFDWGLALADALVAKREWSTDLWSALMHAWVKISVDENAGRKILQKLANVELRQKHARPIAETLRGLISNSDTLRSPEFLLQTNEAARDLWAGIDQSKACESIRDWFTSAINHPVGILSQFWLESWALWRKQQDPVPDTFSDEYRLAFTEIAQNEAITGKLGRAVLMHQFSFLLASDEMWAKENLLSLFVGQTNTSEYQAIWDGFLYGPIGASVASLMKNAFLEAATRVESDLSGEHRRRRFIKAYTIMLAYFVQQPSDIWIPKLLREASESMRYCFTRELGLRLGRMNDSQKNECWKHWLKGYWEDRLQGVPKPISNGEIEGMLNWLLDLEIVFTEAVSLAVNMPPPVQSNRGALVSMLNRSDLWKNYPEDVARLLIYLGAGELPSYTWREGEALIQKLLSSNISSVPRSELQELMAKLGLG